MTNGGEPAAAKRRLQDSRTNESKIHMKVKKMSKRRINASDPALILNPAPNPLPNLNLHPTSISIPALSRPSDKEPW
jgi:hypothetical protein